MRSFGVPDVPCHARPCGWAGPALHGSAWIRGLCGGQAMLWGGRENASVDSGKRDGLGMRSFGVPTSGSCGFSPLGARRELILSTSGSRGFVPLGASLRSAWR
jgi:hypothetical protein